MEERFVADCTLGKLAKWLRILGYDSLYDPGSADRNFFWKAGDEGRIALTRKRNLARLPHAGRLVVVKADDVGGQITEVLEALALAPELGRRMTRCLNCNVPLEETPKETVEGWVPAYVYDRCVRFRKCPSCGKIFWPGTHPRHVEEHLKSRIPARRP
jgi:uncharacterized protein with PIN domain